jgi:hypothetical protein
MFDVKVAPEVAKCFRAEGEETKQGAEMRVVMKYAFLFLVAVVLAALLYGWYEAGVQQHILRCQGYERTQLECFRNLDIENELHGIEKELHSIGDWIRDWRPQCDAAPNSAT